jgi:protein tyrosine phosphatase (PTP) superfamily phosphohydrolase (DUF442 family)
MSCLDWFQAGGVTRGMPRRARHRPWRTGALALLACIVLVQSGCQSGPFSGCNGCGSGLLSPTSFFSRVQSRISNRFNRNCCGSGVVSDGAVEYAAPSSAGATTITPSYPAGSSVGAPSSVGPAPVDAGDLSPVEPKPSSRLGPPSSGGSTSPGSTTANPKTGQRNRRLDAATRIARNRADGSPKTIVSTPEPTSRSAQAVSSLSAANADDQEVLDHLPPLDLPGEAPKAAAKPAVGAVSGAEANPAGAVIKSPDVKAGEAAPDAARAGQSAAPASSPTPEPPSAPNTPPGIARFVAVDLKLAGGSVPSAASLDWLVDKGYRTVLDLRTSSDISPSFVADVTKRGLRYVALPVELGALDRVRVDRFRDELAAAEARPLFFFDRDGTRAGALWYIRRVLHDRVGEDIARREAEELGLKDPSDWSAARGYVAALATAFDRVPVRDAAASSDAPQRAASTGQPSQGAPDPDRAAGPAPSGILPAHNASSQPAPSTSASASPAQPKLGSAVPADANAWRPLAAAAVTGLSLPLAYCASTLIPSAAAKVRASLPAPARARRSLPRASDV